MTTKLDYLKHKFDDEHSLEVLNEIMYIEESKELYLERANMLIELVEFDKALIDLNKSLALLESELQNYQENIESESPKSKIEGIDTIANMDDFSSQSEISNNVIDATIIQELEHFRIALTHSFDYIYSIIKEYDKITDFDFRNKEKEDILDYIEYLTGDDEETLFKKAYAYFQIDEHAKAKEIYFEIIAFDANNIEAYLGIAKICNYNGEHRKAIDCIARALKIDENNVDLLFEMAVNLEKVDLEAALRYYEKILSIDKTSSGAYLNIGRIYYYSYNKNDKALEYYNEGISFSPDTALLGYNARGTLYLDLLKLDEAISDFNKCIEINDNYSRAYVKKAEAMMKKDGDFDCHEVLALLEIAEKVDRAWVFQLYLFKAIVYEKMGEYELSETSYKKNIEIFEDKGVKVLLARLFLKLNRYEEAKDLLEEIGYEKYNMNFLKIFKDLFEKDLPAIKEQNKFPLYNKHRISYMHEMAEYLYILGDYEDSIKLYEILCKKEKKNPVVTLICGSIYYKIGDYKNAHKYFLKTIKRNNSIEMAYNNIGVIYYNQKKYQKALKVFNEVTIKFPYLSNPFFNIAKIYFESGKYENAEPYYTKYIEMTIDGTAYYDRGMNRYYMKRYDDCIKDMEKSIENDCNVPDAFFIMAYSYYLKKDFVRAQRYFKLCLTIEGVNEKIINISTEQLNNIKKMDNNQ